MDGLGEVPAEQARGPDVARGESVHRGAVAGLRHQAGPRAQPVGRLLVGDALVLLGHHRVADPDHPVLHGEDEHRQQRRLLVSRRQRGDGEARRQLSLQRLVAPHPAGRVHEGLERPGHAAEVGGGAEDEAVERHEIAGSSRRVFGRQQLHLGAGNAARRAGDVVSDVRGVSVRAVIDQGELLHGAVRSMRLDILRGSVRHCAIEAMSAAAR